MSFLTMLRQTATIYRPSQTPDSVGDLPFKFAPVSTTKVSIAPPLGPNVDLGPGTQPSFRLREVIASFPAGAGIADRDIIEVTAGANVGSRYRVESPREINAGTSAIHHIEALVEPYTGPLDLLDDYEEDEES